MNKSTLQIDLKPITTVGVKTFTSYYQDLYINGSCYRSILSADTAQQMVNDGIVFQVFGTREENGKSVRFEYPDKVDSAGVQYTSEVYKLTKANP